MARRSAQISPMEALLASELPDGEGWQFEPKWDGFRCLARRDGNEVTLTSKSGKPLARYFPEVTEMLRRLARDDFLLDGELIISVDDSLSFDALQLRLHPAESRIRKLSTETPAELMLFDLLELDGRSLVGEPLALRRAALERFYKNNARAGLHLSPVTSDRDTALAWLKGSGGALDGVIAKRTGLEYRSGERAMIKVKQQRTADCVVGGFRYAEKKKEVGSLLLGLYDSAGLLHHVGFTSALKAEDRPALTKKLESLIKPPGFTGDAPGGPSRWATARSAEWQPLKTELVVEVRYDQVTGRRFRHGTGFVRWRPDKDPAQCTFDQLAPELKPSELDELFGR
ncbi:ATP-dependent DNA ligase [Sphingomonas hankyongi]|uniref:DNA ligase (ATP) n=1 Tax=Sphingomonas hankyongi TaxID=2908209 RepID=A0ABT0S597_9SPHN|nr:ATP-dependent DNA ligase [Sphingomonas hankyongi]MCL6730813.1 ATP-dependent DNA ligase [Sphingomonas hankyongi]